MIKINFKKLSDTAKVPTRGSMSAAGMDLYADEKNSIVVKPHETVKISTGIACEIPEGFFGAVFARSGLSTKMGLRPSTCVSVIDSDYRGEIYIGLHNDTDNKQVIGGRERVAQLVILPYLEVDFCEVEELSETDRGKSGFGSTGSN